MSWFFVVVSRPDVTHRQPTAGPRSQLQGCDREGSSSSTVRLSRTRREARVCVFTPPRDGIYTLEVRVPGLIQTEGGLIHAEIDPAPGLD